MQRWQHAWLTVDTANRQEIARVEQFGAEGWEMVTAVPLGGTLFILFFKRPVPS